MARVRASPRALAALLLLLAVESTAVASLGTPLLATVERVEHVSLAASQWALTIALLVAAIVTPLLGRLAGGSSRRRTILVVLAVMLLGCVVSALPVGFGWFLAGRALQGVGFGLVPLAIAIARDDLPLARRGPVIGAVGAMTAVGAGIGYPIVGALAQWLGLQAPFWFSAALSAPTLLAAALLLPDGPPRPARVDTAGVLVLALGIGALLLVLAEAPSFGWASAFTIGCGAFSAVSILGWVCWELRAASPLVELRLLRNRGILTADVVASLVALGFYPLLSLVVRYVQTSTAAGYGFGASVFLAGAMLTPFSVASFTASRIAGATARLRTEPLLVASCAVVLASMLLFAFARSSYLDIVVTMLLAGTGVGAVYAVAPIEISKAVPPGETGSAVSFYLLARTVSYSLASALSATMLVESTPRGHILPTDHGYGVAALVCSAVLAVALLASLACTWQPRRRHPGISPG